MTTTHELLRQAREALNRMEVAFDWFVGRSGFTQSERLKGLEHSARVRTEAYAAHDAVRTTIATIDAHLSAPQQTPEAWGCFGPDGKLDPDLVGTKADCESWRDADDAKNKWTVAPLYTSLHHLSAGEPAAPQAAAQPVEGPQRVRGWHGKNVSLKTQKNGKVRLVLDLDAVEIAAAYWVTCSPAGGKCPTKKGCAAYGCHGACLDVTDYTATPGEKAALRRRIERIGLAATPSKGESTTPAAWPAGLLERVKSAEQRIRDNHAPRRIPADPTDVDLVLAEVRMLIEGKAPPFWLASPQQDDGKALADEAMKRLATYADLVHERARYGGPSTPVAEAYMAVEDIIDRLAAAPSLTAQPKEAEQ